MAPASLWVYRTLLAVTLPLAAPWLLLHRRRARTPLRLPERLGFHLAPVRPDGIWVQAVSVGEVAVARLLLRELRQRHPELPAVLTSTTATGLRLAAGPQLADVILPFPLDLPGPVHRFFETIRPKVMILVETELWPELLAACGRRGTPVVMANARISDASYPRYRAIRKLLRPLLAPVTLALAQGDQEAHRLEELGIAAERVRVAGNIKFDAAPLGPPPPVLDEVRRLAGARPVVVAGSTMAGEDEMVLDAVRALDPPATPFLLLAPRHPERAGDVAALATARGFAVARRSTLPAAPANADTLVLDTVGELAALYELAAVAFVGGSLVSTGGHNPIEPARFGVPVLTGPYVRNFAAVFEEFLAVGAARTVRDAAELGTALGYWLADGVAGRRAGEAGRRLLARHAGATRRIADALEPFLT